MNFITCILFQLWRLVIHRPYDKEGKHDTVKQEALPLGYSINSEHPSNSYWVSTAPYKRGSTTRLNSNKKCINVSSSLQIQQNFPMKNLFNETAKNDFYLLWKFYFQEKLLKLIIMEDEEISRIRLRSELTEFSWEICLWGHNNKERTHSSISMVHSEA